MGFMDDVNKDADQYGGGGGFKDKFEFEKKGVYRMRILAQPKVLATHFFGPGVPSVICVGKDKGCKYHGADDKKPSIKLVTYVLDRQETDPANTVKLAELPLSLSYAFKDLEEDQDFHFSSFPMPYDIKVTYDPDNSDPKAKYRLTPGTLRSELSEPEQAAFDAKMQKMTPEQYVDKRKAKQIEKSGGGQVSTTASSGAVAPYPTAESEDINPDDIPF